MLHRLAGLALAALAVALATASAAFAAPVSVNVRIEGSAGTLFDGSVTTDAKNPVVTAGAPEGHPCDVIHNGSNGGTGTPVGNPTTALIDAAAIAGLPFDASWTGITNFGTVNDFFVRRVGGDVNQNAAPFASWGLAVNFTPASVGGCQIPVGTRDDVLWAYDFFNKKHLLQLSGPATASVGSPVTLTVRDGQNGSPVAGASVAGATTDAAGNARVTFAQPGVQGIKAEAPDSVRSNALVVSVAAPGAVVAGVTTPVDRTAPRGRVLSPRNGHTYRRARFAPRRITLRVAESGSGIRNVKLRLTRRVGDRCSSYSGKRERFIGQRCGNGFFFTVSDRAAVDYLLPEKLPRGHYVLDVVAIDKSFNRDAVRQRGRNRSVFDVR